MEKGPETTLVLKHGGLQAMIGAYLRIQNDVSFHFVQDLRENALGCICGYVCKVTLTIIIRLKNIGYACLVRGKISYWV